MPSAVVVEDLAMTYGSVEVLSGLTFEVETGEVFALLGSNGAGKTTTVEILEGHRHRTGGRVTVLGTDPERGGRRFLDRIGIVLQSTAIDPDLTVMEAARLQAGYHLDPLQPADALELIGLSETRRQRIGTLSGGQRRRLDLALAIVGRPEVIFLDEPTTGFDPEARRAAWHLVDVLRGEGATVVLTTHYLDEVERLADRVGVLRDGRLVALGSVSQLVGGASRISFRTNPRSARAIIEMFGAHRHGDRLELATDDPRSDLHRLTQQALDNGWPLDDLRVGPPDLESVFLDLVAPRG